MSSLEDCRLIDLPRIPDQRGNLTFIEGERHVPFPIQRTFWIYDVPGDARRGARACKTAEELLIAASGSFDVVLDDGFATRTVALRRSYVGLYVPPGIWRYLESFSTNSVCLVLASTLYDEEDYFRDYSLFSRSKRRAVADDDPR